MVYNMSATLEACGPLATLILSYKTLTGYPVLFSIDNQAVVTGFRKRVSKNVLLASIIRATRFVANMMQSKIFFKWEKRRSSLQTRLVDDLSHGPVAAMEGLDLPPVLEQLRTFPPCLLEWMRNPRKDYFLGHRCWEYICET